MRKKLLPGRPAKKSWNSATITLLLGNRTSVFGATWLIAGLTARFAQGAFIVECRSDGWGYANFSYPGSTAPSASTKSTAPGCKAANSVFGAPHTYIWKYTPGVDADNYAPSAGTT